MPNEASVAGLGRADGQARTTSGFASGSISGGGRPSDDRAVPTGVWGCGDDADRRRPCRSSKDFGHVIGAAGSRNPE
ncbi:MAG TPA: hypothetical protein DCQ98_00195 [Planctomycetaceae bacterium]|nr:hypothetical protein [Planctomycetaceae bacterium]